MPIVPLSTQDDLTLYQKGLSALSRLTPDEVQRLRTQLQRMHKLARRGRK